MTGSVPQAQSWVALAALLGLGVIVAVAALAPDAALPLAATFVAAGALIAVVLQTQPTLTSGFAVVILLSLSAQGNDEGADAFEVAFGIALVAFLATWYGTTVLGGRRFVRNPTDLAIGLYLFCSVTIGVAVGVLFNSLSVDFRSDLTCLLALALFFPAREVCVRSPRGIPLVVGLLLLLGLYAAALNVAQLFGVLSGATKLYEVVDVRVSSGEIQMTASLLLALAGLTTAKQRWLRLVLLAVVVASIGGLVLAKSRGPWITALVGIVVAGILLSPRSRGRILAYALVGGGLAAGVAVLTLGDELFLIGVGLLRRLTSLSNAATGDISLLNRYAESAATWAEILQNPILGYGWGAPVVRYDMVVRGTHHWGFVHNGYLWLWHKVGLWGLALFVAGLFGAVWQGVRAARSRLPQGHRALAAGSVGAIVAFAILGLPSNPFAVLDQILVVALVLALVSGISERGRVVSVRP